MNGKINNLDRCIQLYVGQGKHQVFPSQAQEELTYQIQKNFIIKIIIYSITTIIHTPVIRIANY